MEGYLAITDLKELTMIETALQYFIDDFEGVGPDISSDLETMKTIVGRIKALKVGNLECQEAK